MFLDLGIGIGGGDGEEMIDGENVVSIFILLQGFEQETPTRTWAYGLLLHCFAGDLRRGSGELLRGRSVVVGYKAGGWYWKKGRETSTVYSTARTFWK